MKHKPIALLVVLAALLTSCSNAQTSPNLITDSALGTDQACDLVETKISTATELMEVVADSDFANSTRIRIGPEIEELGNQIASVNSIDEILNEKFVALGQAYFDIGRLESLAKEVNEDNYSGALSELEISLRVVQGRCS